MCAVKEKRHSHATTTTTVVLVATPGSGVRFNGTGATPTKACDTPNRVNR